MMEPWIRLKRSIASDPTLGPTPTHRGCFLWLVDKGRIIHAHITDLSEAWGTTARRTSTILRNLEKRGHIQIHGGGSCRVIFISSPLVETCGFHRTSRARWPDRPGASLWRAGFNIPAATRKRILKRDGEVCRYCGSTEGPFHIDHIKPVARGGSDADSNLCVACRDCNLSKGAKPLKEWERAR